jgi:DNA-binding NarL/FixJ family response regulator
VIYNGSNLHHSPDPAARSAGMSKRISIVLLEDGTNPISEIVTRIRDLPDFQVVAIAAKIDEAVHVVRTARPHVVLLNLQQTGDDTQTIAGALHGSAPDSRVIVMGFEAPQEDVARFLRAGVVGFTMVGATFEVLIDTIHSVARGIPVLPPELTRSLFSQLKRHGVLGRPARTLDVSRLTLREREVAGLLVLGMSNRQIADRLDIALHTVKSHVHRVLTKLAVNNRLEIAAFSREGRPGPEPNAGNAPAAKAADPVTAM